MNLKVDVLIAGAGLAGLYAAYKLELQGFSFQGLEAASDVGGVWYWNRYPGARCDVESLQYSYSFSKDLEQEWIWTERYAAQPEILRYIEYVADRFDLRKHFLFNSRIVSANFDEASGHWLVKNSEGMTLISRYCIMATGALSVPKLPEISGIELFSRPIYHTGAWPKNPVNFTNQKVGVIGTGSSGIQVIPAIAKQAALLTVFQRTANFSIPAWNRPLSSEDQAGWKKNYAIHRDRARQLGTLYDFSDKAAHQVSDEERTSEYQRRWDLGGVNFIHAFNDLMVNKSANDTIADFVCQKIRQIVKDPLTAQSLCPNDHPLGTKRICVDTGYYKTFNLPHVKLVDLKLDPISQVTPEGIQTRSALHELDALVCATGYDALTGAVLQLDIRGRQGVSLKSKWSQGPRTYLGLMTEGFPNLFFISGAGSPSVLVNMVVGIEHHIDWITECLNALKSLKKHTIEPSLQAQDDWVEHVNQAADKTLLPLANSWFLGANIPGKPRVFMPYVARIGVYRDECQKVADQGYTGFRIS